MRRRPGDVVTVGPFYKEDLFSFGGFLPRVGQLGIVVGVDRDEANYAVWLEDRPDEAAEMFWPYELHGGRR